MNPYAIPKDPSLPPVPPIGRWEHLYCECPSPVPVERAERRGATRTHCARCDRELPLRMGRT